MTITKSGAALLGRRAERPVTAAGELLAIWVPGILRNPLNGLKHWRAEKRYRKEWHEAVALALLEAGWGKIRTRLCDDREALRAMGMPGDVAPWDYVPKIQKRITVVAQTFNRMDRDGLYAALKPVIDGLSVNGVIHDDAEPVNGVGHVIECSQRIDRARRGVEIRVSLR